jgi:hypothetical protein
MSGNDHGFLLSDTQKLREVVLHFRQSHLFHARSPTSSSQVPASDLSNSQDFYAPFVHIVEDPGVVHPQSKLRMEKLSQAFDPTFACSRWLMPQVLLDGSPNCSTHMRRQTP